MIKVRDARPDDLAAWFSDIGCAPPGMPYCRQRVLDQCRGIFEPEAFAQQHGQRKNLAAGIRDVEAGEVVGAAVVGLVDGVTLRVEVA